MRLLNVGLHGLLRTMSEHNLPSDDERRKTLERGDFLKLSGDGVFATLQGEGITAGAPAIFLRLQDCNLKCGFAGTVWRCDAWYTWDRTTHEHWQESSNIAVDDVSGMIKDSWSTNFRDEQTPRLIITGGEPLLQQTNLLPLLKEMNEWEVEIETNVTVMPDDELQVCQFNCSPKLESSGILLKARYRPAVLQKIASFPNSWFKFVVSTEEDLEEIVRIVDGNEIDRSRVILMSEGVEAEKLKECDEDTARFARELGFTAMTRNHIYWYGDKRAT